MQIKEGKLLNKRPGVGGSIITKEPPDLLGLVNWSSDDKILVWLQSTIYLPVRTPHSGTWRLILSMFLFQSSDIESHFQTPNCTYSSWWNLNPLRRVIQYFLILMIQENWRVKDVHLVKCENRIDQSSQSLLKTVLCSTLTTTDWWTAPSPNSSQKPYTRCVPH